ncbi:MAG TPA: branched-chain amino acid ABC transporter permease [Thermoleophilia bacterium]|nr:branched-chain amino acid ABC transporter permease [Thermoleophilia bacterium]
MADEREIAGIDASAAAEGRFATKLNPIASALIGGPTRRQRLLLVVLLAVAIALPFVVQEDRWVTLMTVVVTYVVLASGLNIVVGFTGLLDLGYVAFYAIGAYYTAIIFQTVLVTKFGVNIDHYWWLMWVNLVVGGLLAALAGVLIGYPTLRVRGDYLAIMTLGFGEIIRIVASNWVGLTRGPSGIPGIPAPALGGYHFTTSKSLYFLGLALALVSLWTISRIVRSRIGRAWTAIREDEIAAEAMGIHTSRYKLLSYATGAFFAGMMGVFFGHYINYISPSSFQLMQSFLILSLVVLGGMGNIAGPVLGATIWIALQEYLRNFTFVQIHPETRGIALGLVLVLLMVFRPQGLLGSLRVALEMRPGSRGEAEHERQEWSDASH